MPIPSPSLEAQNEILSVQLAQSAVDLAAHIAYIKQLKETIEAQDEVIAELSTKDETQ